MSLRGPGAYRNLRRSRLSNRPTTEVRNGGQNNSHTSEPASAFTTDRNITALIDRSALVRKLTQVQTKPVKANLQQIENRVKKIRHIDNTCCYAHCLRTILSAVRGP